MRWLIITDIPRLTALFEQLEGEYPELKVATDIDGGIAMLKGGPPELILFQNYLSGLSAGIIHKHLLKQLAGNQVRFGLIGQQQGVDPETASLFQEIIDPAADDLQISEGILRLFENIPKPSAVEPVQPEGVAEVEEEQPVETGVGGEVDAEDAPAWSPSSHLLTYRAPEPLIDLPESGFDQELEQSRDNLSMEEAATRVGRFSFEQAEDPNGVKPLKQDGKGLRRNLLIFSALALSAALLVTFYQQRTAPPPAAVEATEPAAGLRQPVSSSVQSQLQHDTANSAIRPELASHGAGRPKQLPAFIPQGGEEKGFEKDNPGWQLYRGKTLDYRVFRGDDGGIKAIQLLDHGGAGIQEGYYKEVIRSLAGTDTMRTISSEINEGYEIRRGELSGLQLVQYRDASGGRLRGVVITWP